MKNHLLVLSFIVFLPICQPLRASHTLIQVDVTKTTTLANDLKNSTYTENCSFRVCDDCLDSKENILTEGYVRENAKKTYLIPKDITFLITQFCVACVLIFDKNDINCLIHPKALFPIMSGSNLIMYHLGKDKNVYTVDTYAARYIYARIDDGMQLRDCMMGSQYALDIFDWQKNFFSYKPKILERSFNRILMAAGYSDGSVKIFNFYKREEPYLLPKTHTGAISTLSWNRDNRHICISSSGDILSVWDMFENCCIKKVKIEYTIPQTQWSYDGKSLFYQYGSLFRIPFFEETSSDHPLKINLQGKGSLVSFQCSPESKKLTIIYADKKNSLLLYDYGRDDCQFLNMKNEDILQTCWYGKQVIYYSKKKIKMLDSETGKIVNILEKEKALIFFMDISKDGYLAICTLNSTELWDLNPLQPVKIFESFIILCKIKWQGNRLIGKVVGKDNLYVIENKDGDWVLRLANIKDPGIYG